MPLGEPHTHIWTYMLLGTPTPPGSPTEYSMDTYSILQQVRFQGLRCVAYTLWLRELLISQTWHFFSPKQVQKRFRSISETFHSWQCWASDSWLKTPTPLLKSQVRLQWSENSVQKLSFRFLTVDNLVFLNELGKFGKYAKSCSNG